MRQRMGVVICGALVSALGIAGCGSSGVTSGGPGAAIKAHPGSATADGAAHAKDGTNYAACASGNCEVEIAKPTDIPLGGHGDVTTMKIIEVTPSSIKYTTSKPSGFGGSGGVSGNAVVSFGSGDGSSSVTVRLIGADGDAPIMRLSSS